ncbi:MAG: hypothetical protein AB7S26_16040 [Sandaracinaceae bacterium]
MNKRLAFFAIASAFALGITGCDGDGDGSDAGCGSPICLDGSMPDAGGGRDAGDAGPGTPACGAPGRSGANCRMGMCLTGLTCLSELSIMGMPLTLGNVFEIQEGTLDTTAMFPEYTPSGPSSIRVSVAGADGICSEGCSTTATTDTCGECSFCNEDIGGSSSFGAVGITIRTFDNAYNVIGTGEDGICRQRCEYMPGTNGGCPTGNTCDRFTNTCLESCLSDDQCNLSWGDSRAEGLVAIRLEGTPFTCNTGSGQCEWTAPATAAFGSDCDSSADCAAGTGLCYFGHCTETSCVNSTNDGAGAGSCPADAAACFGAGGNNASFCLGLCNTADDCAPEHACSPLMTPVTDQAGTMFPGVCSGPCEGNTECQMSRRCDNTVQRFTDETLGICNEFCDPTGGTLAGAITCDTAAGEICEAVEGQNYGFCKDQNRLCFSNESCNGDQRCRMLGNDGLGRCEDSCTATADCNAAMMEECVIVDTDPDDGTAETRGVCIAPGGTCSPSGISTTTGQAIYLLRGSRGDNQCVSTQVCDAPVDPMTGMPMPNALGNCIDGTRM